MTMLQWQWPWAIVAAIIGVAIVIALMLVIAARRDRRAQQDSSGRHDQSGQSTHADTGIEVWSMDADFAGEEASHLLRRWRALTRLAAVLLAVLLAVAAVLMGRPSTVDAQTEHSETRDIVLCLDVSGSALPYDREVIATYLDLVRNFQGERIGLSIFNSTSRTVFPLTDDYDLVTAQLNEANELLKGVQTQDDIDNMSDADYQRISDWLAGTQNRKQATSLIGDGLVNCAAMLPGLTVSSSDSAAQSTNRSASIVLATDNVVSGTPTYSLEQALDLTRSADISVDGLYSGPVQSIGDAASTEMQSLIESHGGVFLAQRTGESVSALVRQIESRRTEQSQQDNRSSLVDIAAWPTLILAVVFGGYLVVVWRLRR